MCPLRVGCRIVVVVACVFALVGCSVQTQPQPSENGKGETGGMFLVDDPPVQPPIVSVVGMQATLLSSQWLDEATGLVVRDYPGERMEAGDMAAVEWSETLAITISAVARPMFLSIRYFAGIQDGIPQSPADPINCISLSDPCLMAVSGDHIELSVAAPADALAMVLDVMYAIPVGPDGSLPEASDNASYGVTFVHSVGNTPR